MGVFNSVLQGLTGDPGDVCGAPLQQGLKMLFGQRS